jgi:hypothetical protein
MTIPSSARKKIIEAVAMAMVNSDHQDPEGSGNLPDWSILPDWKRAEWRKHAHAAIKAYDAILERDS